MKTIRFHRGLNVTIRWEMQSLFTRSFPKLNRIVYNLSLTRSAIFDFLNIVFPTLSRASSREALIVVIRHFPDIHSTAVPLAEVYAPTACRYVVQINPPKIINNNHLCLKYFTCKYLV